MHLEEKRFLMHELPHRLGVAVLLLSGALTAFVPAHAWLPIDWAAYSIAIYGQFVLALLGTGLLLAAFLPSWRLPAIVVAIMSKSAFLVILAAAPDLVPPFPGAAALERLLLLLLMAAGAVFAREAWQEARWNGMLPIRLEF
jgi:hypothetical protein